MENTGKQKRAIKKWEPEKLETLEQRIAPCSGGGAINRGGNDPDGPNPGNGGVAPGH